MTRRADVHRRIVDDLTHHTRPEFTVAVRAIMDARPALPGATAYDGTRRSESSSSVETLALTPDRTAAEIAQLDRVLRRLEADAMWLRAFIGRHQPRHPSQRDQAEVERANTERIPECHWMRRHTDTFEPALCESTLGGLLDEARHVSRWVYDFARSKGRLPSAGECQRHAAGQTVRVTA